MYSRAMSSRRIAVVLALATMAVLLAMVVVSLATGATQELHEHYVPPDVYARDLLAHAAGLRLVMGLDVAFLVLYSAFFIALADHLRASPFTKFALGAMLGVALLDIVEDHHILSLLAVAEAGRPIDDVRIALQDTLSQVKFSLSYLALTLFGLAIPRTDRLGWVLCVFLTAGTLASAVLGYGSPPAWRASLDSVRWIGFLGGFGLATAWLARQPD
jgi:hypothetical protein